MKYVVTGAAGNISSILVRRLLLEGHQVHVIGRNAGRMQELTRLGAKAITGSLEDRTFVVSAFRGADAAYCMYPTDLQSDSLTEYAARIAQNYAAAIQENKIRYVVNLSSIGAHLATNAGPVCGMNRAETILNALPDVNIVHLRPGFFHTNLFGSIGLIKASGIMGNCFALPMGRFPVAHRADIAAVAADHLLKLQFKGHQVQYVVSEETGTDEIATQLGEAISMPHLKWVKLTGEQMLFALLNAGFSQRVAEEHVELFSAIDSELISEQYWQSRPIQFGTVTMRDFAKEFAMVYQSN
jgi:uncharacterized protein YbjT (DUF2867 family)